MPATLSADAALPSTKAFSPVAEAQGYFSVHGDFSYYPTSAHKRRAPCEASDGAVVGTTDRVAKVTLSPSTHRRPGRADNSPSPSGLSCSPSQGTLDIGSLSRRSSSQPLASTQLEGNAVLKSVSVSPSFVKGGAPLLHRYRTSRANTSQRSLHRSASLPLQGSTCTLASTGVATKRLNNVRRSLLHTRSATVAKACTTPAPPKDDVAQEAVLQEPRATQVRPQNLPLSTSSFSRKRADNADAEVPLTSVRLGAAAPASSSSLKKSSETPVEPVAASRRVTGTSCVNDVHVEGKVCGKGEDQGASTASFSEQMDPSSVLSRSVTTALYCHEKDCLHSEQSICEFIQMQRELRRCYATMENYEVMLARLRDDCALSRAQLCRFQQEYTQNEKEVEAQGRAEITEQRDALLSALRQSNVNDASNLKISVGLDHDPKEATEERLRDTWQATVDGLRSALREEQSAHAECLARLTEAMAAKARWKSRAVELLKWRKHVCRQIYTSSTPSFSSLSAGTSATSTGGSQTAPDAENSASNVSSPSPRLCCPSSPYKPPSCISSLPEARNLHSSVMSEVSSALPASPYEEGTDQCATDRKSEKDSSSTPAADRSCQSDSTAVSFLSPSATPAERVAKAVGSGVVVWPPLAGEQGGPTGKSAESSQTQPLTTAVALESSASAVLDDAGKQALPSSSSISPVSSGVLPSRVVRYTTSAAGSCTQDGYRPSWVDCEKNVVAAEPLRVVRDLFAFPRPPPCGGVGCTIRSIPSTPEALPTSCAVSAAMAPDSAERKCIELLRALLDKEKQLAFVAEERTKYKHLYEATQR
ncbi:hypothetical protein, unknown function [Leishmania tarentolae]|uniref:Uncharacterized protein n=1 Tax=Leishmania tarentolae TaxID=5689 RepID=A0A640KC83_LEITA|nr:hypothetical protein, unknown function [Leishmania tarentolae]